MIMSSVSIVEFLITVFVVEKSIFGLGAVIHSNEESVEAVESSSIVPFLLEVLDCFWYVNEILVSDLDVSFEEDVIRQTLVHYLKSFERDCMAK